jgi:hypothetical protein
VVFKHFVVWLTHSDQPFFDFFSSIPLIILYIILWRKKAFESHYFTFSFLLLLPALLIYVLFAETGYRMYHANFYWQIPITLFLTHFSILISVGKSYFNNGEKISLKVGIMATIYFLQCSFGLAFWLRIVFSRILM